MIPCCLFQKFRLLQDTPRVFYDPFPGRRRGHAARGSLKNAHAQCSLQSYDRPVVAVRQLVAAAVLLPAARPPLHRLT
jgi:hypothetical protein